MCGGEAGLGSGAVIGLSTEEPRGLGGGAASTGTPCVTFKVHWNVASFKENTWKKKKPHCSLLKYDLTMAKVDHSE